MKSKDTNNSWRNMTAIPLMAMLLLLAACSDPDAADNQPNPIAPKVAPMAAKQQPQPASNDEIAGVATTEVTTSEPAVADGISAALEFNLTDLEGNTVKATDYRGQWLVLNYWATWCAPCRDEMPELVKFQAENDQVQVLGIAFEDADVDKLKSFAADFNINYPLLTIDVYNPPGFAEEGGMGLPTTIVYTPEGMRHKKHMGPIDAEGLLQMIQ